MAEAYVYKNQKKGRQATVETTFSKGMSYSSAPLEEGYVKMLVNFDYAEDNKILVPRAGLRTTEFVFPDVYSVLDEDFYSPDVCIKDMKECVEDGEIYVQCILGKPDDEDNTKGKIWVATFKKKNDQNSETEFDMDGKTFEIAFNDLIVCANSMECTYYNTDLQEIHGLRLKSDARIGFPVGTFAYGNHYYFFAHVIEDGKVAKKLYRTCFGTSPTGEKSYRFEAVDEKKLTASEAVLYGYNMLSDTPYSFKNNIGSSKIILEGILPYESSDEDAPLVMTPRKNQTLNYRCYYSAPVYSVYKFVWEWRSTGSDTWALIDSESIMVSEDGPSSVNFLAPTDDIMIRVKAFNPHAEDASDEDPVPDHAMVVGFDFSIDEHGTTTNIVQKNYNLGDATGMTVWKNRLALWGIQEDPTILLLSDMNEPGYFPYPNNITVFDEPIISVAGFMDSLIVFTTNKCYQVALSDDGTGWTTTVIQSNLYITGWDKHLIQPVRNMLFFKSGNYYYMMVPKAASTTGELTLAPISNPVIEFFNNFMVNVEQLFKDTYGSIDSDAVVNYELITYYNFLDYEDVHNMYVFRWSGSDTLIHLDVVYNTVDRNWRINVIEEPNLLYIYRYDATQTGIYAATSLMAVGIGSQTSIKRVIQLYKFDPLYVKDFFVPDDVVLSKEEDESFRGPYIVGHTLRFPAGLVSVDVDEGVATVSEKIIDKSPVDGLGFLYTFYNIGEFNKEDLIIGVRNVIANYSDYFKYRNYQFLDTGYRADATHFYKKYRELQLQINNLDGEDLNFGTEFYLDGDIRKTDFEYEVVQVIDEMSENYNIAYIEPMVFMDIPSNAIDRVNLWTLEHGLNPELSLWKVRMQVSGKGTAPRLKLSSRNEVRYQLLGLNWVYRVMNMR